jgi:hypothetical protein
MSNIAVKLGSSTIDLTGTGDLGTRLAPGVDALLHLSDDLALVADGRLADVPAGSLQSSFQTNQQAKWNLDGVNLTLSFQPTAAGSITITKSGELFNYHPGDDPAKTVSIPVPAGHVYVSVGLKVGLAVSAGASFSSNGFGVSGNISNNDQFGITNHRCFPADTPVSAAIADAFRGFVLPFKAAGVENLNDNDYLDFTFIGRLALGFGVTYGYSGLLLGGRSNGEINASLSNNPLGKIVFSAKPTFKASAEFSVKYAHDDAFRVVVGRQKAAAINGVSLYLFRTDKSSLTTQFTAGITLSANAKFNASTNIDQVLDNAGKAAVAKLPAEIQGVASSALSDQLKKAEGKIDGFVATINKNVNDLLKQGDGQKIELQLMHERITTDTALFQYSFDFNADPSAAGFDSAMKGDYVTAIGLPGVTLAPGSFVEHAFIRRSSLALQFFGLWKFTSVTEYFQNTKITYAGNGVFHVRAKTGVSEESGAVGHTGQCQVYFTASASDRPNTGTISDLDVQLTFVLIDNKNRNATNQTIAALESLGAQSLTADMEEIRRANLGDAVVRITCTFPKGAYEGLTFDAYLPNGKPGPMPHDIDARNYMRMVDAISTLDENAPDLFKSFDNWALYNVVKNDREGSTKPADRRNSGNIGGSSWPTSFPSLDNADRARVGCYFEAGRNFMNLCEDLKNLSAEIDTTTTEESFQRLLKTLNGIIGQDVPVFFIKPALVALLRAANATPANIQFSGVTGGKSIDVAFEAGLLLSAPGRGD